MHHLFRRRPDPAGADTPAVASARTRADDALRRARERNALVVTLDVAGSPADSCNTVVIPRPLFTDAELREAAPDFTPVRNVEGRAR